MIRHSRATRAWRPPSSPLVPGTSSSSPPASRASSSWTHRHHLDYLFLSPKAAPALTFSRSSESQHRLLSPLSRSIMSSQGPQSLPFPIGNGSSGGVPLSAIGALPYELRAAIFALSNASWGSTPTPVDLCAVSEEWAAMVNALSFLWRDTRFTRTRGPAGEERTPYRFSNEGTDAEYDHPELLERCAANCNNTLTHLELVFASDNVPQDIVDRAFRLAAASAATLTSLAIFN